MKPGPCSGREPIQDDYFRAALPAIDGRREMCEGLDERDQDGQLVHT